METFFGAGSGAWMVQLCILLDIHTCIYLYRTVQLTGWVTSIDDVTVEFKDGVSGGDTIQTGPDGHCRAPDSGIKITWQHYLYVKFYCQRCQKSCSKMKNKHQAKLNEGIILRLDAVCLHVVHSIQDWLNILSWEMFKHQACSLVLLPYTIHIFRMLQTVLESYVFI
jgi:hypothetical protein